MSIGTICQWRGRLPKYPHSIPTDHKVRLSTRDIPLQVGLSKVAPRFVGPLEIEKIINPVAVRLKLPSTVRIHPTFHASRLKPVHESSLVPASPPPPPTRLVDGGPGVCDTWWTGRVMARRKGPGFLRGSSWIRASSRPRPALLVSSGRGDGLRWHGGFLASDSSLPSFEPSLASSTSWGCREPSLGGGGNGGGGLCHGVNRDNLPHL